MNQISSTDRARITAMLARVISELAGNDPALDQAVAQALTDIVNLCCLAKLRGTPEQAWWGSATKLVTEKDWLLSIVKIGNSFQFEAKFGEEMKPAGLKESVRWLSEAGAN